MTMQSGKYARILPAAPVRQSGESSTPSPKESEPDSRSRRRPTQTRPGACIECRNRKTKCDGGRPACSHCTKRGLPLCVYPERLVHGHKSIELLELFKSLSEDRAVALLKLLRTKGDTSIVITEFKGNIGEDTPFPPDSSGSIRHRNSLERELMTHNPQAYPVLLPIDPVALAGSSLLRPKRHAAQSGLTVEDGNWNPNSTAIEAYEVSKQLPEYCDERLHNLQVEFWTNIGISSDYAARVISLYIRTDHPLLGLFNPYLFVTDLVDKSTKYCSRFLFHSIMYLGSQMYSGIDDQGVNYAGAFRRKAEELWQNEEDSYTKMAGAVLMSIALMGNGIDHSVLLFAKAALDVGERLGLFRHATRAFRHEDSSQLDPNDHVFSSKCYAAWGTFNWNVLVSMFYRQPGSETPKVVPIVPIPGVARAGQGRNESDEPVEGDERDDDEDAEFPFDERLLGKIFPAVCNLWRILHRARWIYYVVEESPPGFLRTSLVECAYRELIAWAEALPPDLIRREGNPHYVTVFHIWLHTAILDIWQPFVYRDIAKVPVLRTFSARIRTPDSAYAASVNQLKHLVVEYRSKYAASTYSILWHNGLIYLANSMLRCEDPEWRIYLLLCIYAYERLNHAYRFCEVVIQGLLTMSMRDTDMTGTEAYKIMETLENRGLLHVKEDVEEKVRATFMIDLKLALRDPEAAMAENVAQDFEETALFQDLIDLDQMQT
ncbi:hypothetical protein GGS20DRAFT_558587 [Poronia punctata]|nr:hypothetical protein GGS20DRAFT_558587 [Poronia punctata]